MAVLQDASLEGQRQDDIRESVNVDIAGAESTEEWVALIELEWVSDTNYFVLELLLKVLSRHKLGAIVWNASEVLKDGVVRRGVPGLAQNVRVEAV